VTKATKRLCLAQYCIALSVFVAGCGGNSVKGIDPNLVRVTGKVTYDGKPLNTGDISFISLDNPGKGYASVIDAQGNYSLAYSPSAKGALPGNYNVRVAALDGVPTMGDKGELTQPKSLIPVKYNDPSLSGLKATVEKGKSNVFNFDLKPE
jgi:hypothetical protein